jgi:hypothetical protein
MDQETLPQTYPEAYKKKRWARRINQYFREWFGDEIPEYPGLPAIPYHEPPLPRRVSAEAKRSRNKA